MKRLQLSKLFKKTLGVIGLVFLFILLTISILMATRVHDQLLSESNSKGTAIAESVADAGIDLILNRDAATLQSKVSQYLDIEGVEYLIVRNAQKEVISHTFVPAIPDAVAQFHAEILEASSFEADVIVKRLKGKDKLNVLDITAPIISGEIGFVHVGMDLNPIFLKIKTLVLRTIALLSLIFLLGLFFLFILVSNISRPLQRLMAYAKALGDHHFKDAHPLQIEIKEMADTIHDEIGDLSATFVEMEDQLIENIQNLEKTIVAKQQIETELKIATAIQMSMLPKEEYLKEEADFSIKGFIQPAKEVGGDFYDYFCRNSQECCFLVGDVSGKGASAALFMAMALTLIRSVGRQMDNLSDMMMHVNQYLCQHNDNGLFVTLWIGILNFKTGQLDYVNAGHPQPILKKSTGTVDQLPLTDGLVLGFDEAFYYQTHMVQLESGDSLCVFSDGVTEAMNKEDDLFSEEALATHIEGLTETDPEKTQASILETVEGFVQETAQHDDMTLLNMTWHPQPLNLTNPLKVHFKNEISEIAKLHQVIEQFSKSFNLDDTMAMNMNVSLEELLSNIIFYGYEDHDEHLIHVVLEYKNEKLHVTIEDDGIPFNPLERPDIDLSSSLEDTEVGGLGIHFVKNLMDDLYYERIDNKNVLSMILSHKGAEHE